MRFEPAPSTRATRWVYGGLALVYFTVCGMIIYFRVVPFRRVVNRFQEQGTELPAWFDLVFSGGILLVLALLAWRGVAMLLKAIRG